MAYYDDLFNTSGKIPTDADFWKMAVDRYVTSDGITPAFSKVLAEQLFAPINSPKTPFYNKFAGRPVSIGAGWTERVLKQKSVDHFNPKATAEDDLKFYDNEGIEKSFAIDYEMVRSDSIPSDLMSTEEFVTTRGITALNDRIYTNQIDAYQMNTDSAIAKKAISNTKAEVSVDTTDLTKIEDAIRDTATDMMCRDTYYNDLEVDDQPDVDTSAKEVLAFMPVKLWNNIRNSHASLPSPSELVNNVTVIPVYGDLPTPLTTAEWGQAPSSGITWTDKPTAIDKAKPIVWLVDPRKVEYRPVIGSYKVNMRLNGRGDFWNAHLIARGCVGVRPWYNAVRIISNA